MANDITWQAGNRFAGVAMALTGLAAMLIQVWIGQTITANEMVSAVCAGLLLTSPVLVMYVTEKWLAKVYGS
jgi:hypothetical protein